MTARSIRKMLFVVTMFACAFAARSASAQSCTNDIDCTANPACGGDVCDWVITPGMMCRPAGGQATGHDGWCTVDTDCKCHAQGATCNVTNAACTFTRPCEADGGTCAGGGGSTGTGTGGSSGGGCSVAGNGVTSSWSLLLAAFGLVALRRARRRR
jgi:MYXO-CTERM domain-containing protein